MPRRCVLACVLGMLLVAPTGCGRPDTPAVLIFAAASLKTALDELTPAIRQATGVDLRLSAAASSTLARQIEAGADADIFISADRDWMDYVEQRTLLKPGTRTVLLGNRLVLIAPRDRPVALRIAPGFPLAQALGDGRLAIADPDAVPAGKYGQAALTRLGVWDDLASRLAPADNVRAALLFVARGESPLGIVYHSDAVSEDAVTIVDTFPADTHPPIEYPAALTSRAGPDADRVLGYLRGAEAGDVFRRHGFVAGSEIRGR